jgi:hypothetical protein
MERKYFKKLEQGTDEWFQARLGKVTASEFKTVLSKGRGSAPSLGRRTYMLKLIGERFTGQPMDTFTNHHMERGKAQEEEARLLYEMTTGNDVEQCGFITMGDDVGCSPDGLVNSNGMVEIKCRLPHIQLELAIANKNGKAVVPGDNMAQCQGALLVGQREWLDYVSYSPGLPDGANIVVLRVERDESYIRDLSVGIKKFLTEMNEIMGLFK